MTGQGGKTHVQIVSLFSKGVKLLFDERITLHALLGFSKMFSSSNFKNSNYLFFIRHGVAMPDYFVIITCPLIRVQLYQFSGWIICTNSLILTKQHQKSTAKLAVL